ncbi:4-alpha-glucanotransferase [Pelosinus fermentans]|uniref:bifunctional glycogen debranching protein GlgX/4-alpha-glucanotransferase n=1 Tax=Pelosinus fermentans TaxID=365349 RepID=UPI0002684B9A|nr:bifunctional glycogen debranching protein GlgX/4-alpha-glucanotransferase [Pelosinus fermentans]OAM92558.1 4-alpha-glucanotransferase [Pelosinus fermentans DSM 17108]SDQ48879.1 4-alpha-glucanotransferase [Pelosinus fermentans]
MKQELILHDSQLEFFRSPFGAVCCNQPIVLHLKIQNSVTPVSVVLRLWREDRGEEKIPMKQLDDSGQTILYQVQLNAPLAPCIMWYYFIIRLEDKVYYYGNQTDRLGGIGQLYEAEPPGYQITVYKNGAVTPDWFKGSVMYQIFPDRFYKETADGQVLAAPKGSVIHAHWDNHPYYIRDADTGRIVSYDFFGGNLQGVIAKLPYLKELGVSVIYFNPIFVSPSNHRYDTGDYKTIDAMLGDNQTFRALCEKAKEYGIAVILDGVFSHTGSDSIYFNREGNYPVVGAYQSKESPYYNWYRFKEYPHSYEAWWGIDTMPNVEENEPSYVDYIIEGRNSVIRQWLQLGAKGWRLDVADELPDEFIKRIYKTMKNVDPDSVLIGEVWEDASNKESYGKLRKYLQGDELDSVMNYPFRGIVLDFILGAIGAPAVHRRFMSLAENYPRQNFYAMMNLIGSHDVARVLTLLGEAPSPDSLTVAQQAVYRLPADKRQLGIARLKILVLWQMTFPGVPSIYYGDEAGVEGFKDPYNRRTYPWGQEDQELLAWYKQVIAVHNRYDVFKTGEWISLPVHEQVYGYIRKISNGKNVFSQSAQDNTAVILLNSSVDQSITVELPIRKWCHGVMIDMLNNNQEIRIVKGMLTVCLQPLEGKVLLQVEKSFFPRQAGILLHPTSLTSKYGIGDLGKEAYEFIDFLHKSKQKLWQVLPLNPVGDSHSPYQCPSAFAGNPLLISLDKLVSLGFLNAKDLGQVPVFPDEQVIFSKVKEYKESLLYKAFMTFRKQRISQDYERFCKANHGWLSDYTLFMALKTYFKGQPWHLWSREAALREPAALKKYKELLADDIDYHTFLQFIFFSQWEEVKKYANQQQVNIIGDIPIFVAHDSCDVWANQQLFDLDENGRAKTVAGVPPDYFSKTGQLWGNPHYRWAEMAKDDYRWWRERLQVLFSLVDIIRVDHFRGFESFWEVPAIAETAEQGQWVKGPGERFFRILQKHLGPLPIIVEDLGIITPEVEDLKYELSFPGIKVLQFSFYFDEQGKCIPFTCEKNVVIYTGTHDNDTISSWYEKLLAEDLTLAACIQQEIGLDEEDGIAPHWKFIEFLYKANADTAIVPLQDILGLSGIARMNLPGTAGGSNWAWRLNKKLLTNEVSSQLAGLTEKYARYS